MKTKQKNKMVRSLHRLAQKKLKEAFEWGLDEKIDDDFDLFFATCDTAKQYLNIAREVIKENYEQAAAIMTDLDTGAREELPNLVFDFLEKHS